MDKSVREQGAPVAWAKQMAEELLAYQQRLQELLALQRSSLKELRTELAALQQADPPGEKAGLEPLGGSASEPEARQPLPGSGPTKPNPPSAQPTQAPTEEFRQRYELALEDIRRLEAENRQLREQLETCQAQTQRLEPEGLENWETFKRRVLESLEAEQTEGSPPTAQTTPPHRVQIEEVLAKTESLLAAKDRELESLRHLLENQAANLGAVAVGAAAVEQLLDQDEIIRQQRETLQRLEAEWREKLRQAEVQLSLERAALARKQAELEEKLREVEELRSQLASSQTDPTPQKTPEGWRKFFGLHEGRKK